MMIAIATASALALVGAAALASAAHGEPTNVVRLGKRRRCHGIRDVRTVRLLLLLLLLLGVPIGASHNGSQMPVLLLLVLWWSSRGARRRHLLLRSLVAHGGSLRYCYAGW